MPPVSNYTLLFLSYLLGYFGRVDAEKRQDFSQINTIKFDDEQGGAPPPPPPTEHDKVITVV